MHSDDQRGGRVRRRGDEGFSLIETVVSVTILSLSSMGFVAVALSTTRLERENEAFANAVELGRTVVEQMQAVEFSEVFARFNSEAADDPEGVGTAVGGLWSKVDAYAGDAMARSGDEGPKPITCQVSFPVVGGTTQIREDMNLPEFGLPADLNGDGVLDSADHSGDYTVLPVILQLTYPGATGARTLRLATVLRNG